MELKTKVAEDGEQALTISREFDLPVDLLFKAHAEPDLFEQWMSHEYATTKVLKYEAKKFGAWQFQSTDSNGNVVFAANGVIHDFLPNQKIIRTFEMENTPFPVQLEFLEFEKISGDRSKLNMRIVYRSKADRDNMLKIPFGPGMNMAHNRLQEVIHKLK